MKKLMYIAATCGIVILAGCASLDDRLASNDPRVRSAAERELLQISRATGTEADRVAAVKRITDKDYLYEIAMNATTNAWVAEDATFDASPYDGFQKSYDGKTRVYYKITFGTPSYVTVRGKRLDTTKEGVAAVEQLQLDETQKENLVKIFKLIHKAESDQVKLSAFKCVKDPKRIQTAARFLAMHATDPKVQAVGLAKLDPEERLSAIARNGSDAKERLEAFNKLKDQKAIDEIALKTNDKAILLAGMSKVSDKEALASRVFGKDFAADGNAIDLGLVLEFLKRVGDGRKEIWSKLAKQGQLQEIETRMARLYHDKHASMSDEDKAVLISAITTPEVIAKMIVPPTKNEIAAEESARSQKRKELEELIEKKEKKVEECEEESENYARYAENSRDNFHFSDAKKEKKKSKEFKAQAELLKSEIVELRKKIETLKKPTANPFYINDKGARSTLLAKVSPDILDKVFPFKGMLGITLGQVTEVSGGRYEISVTRVDEAEGKLPSAIRVPFTPQHGLPQFSSYWYRTSVKSHRVFMIEAQTKTPFRRNEIDLLVKSLEKKYGQKAEKWMGECVYLGESVGEIKNYFATKYTFYFPGNRRLVVTDRDRCFGGGFMDEVIMSQLVDEKERGYVSLVAYDDDTMGIAVSEMNEQSREWDAREHKKSADAAQSISDAL